VAARTATDGRSLAVSHPGWRSRTVGRAIVPVYCRGS
jgi:hypothetical protein